MPLSLSPGEASPAPLSEEAPALGKDPVTILPQFPLPIQGLLKGPMEDITNSVRVRFCYLKLKTLM